MSHQGTDAVILVDEYNFSAYTSQLQVDLTVGEAEGTTLASTAQEWEPLLPTMKITQNGYFQGVAADGFERELFDRMGTTGVVVSAIFGVSGSKAPAYVIPDAFNAQMDFQMPAAGLMTLNGIWGNTNHPKRGVVVYRGTLSATGATTAVNLGAAGSNGGLFVVHVTAVSGSASGADIALESATTQAGTYAAEGTVTFSAVGGYTAALTGTVNRWLRINATDLGGATSFTVTAIAIVDGVTM